MGKGRNNVPKIHCLDDDGEEDEDIVQGKESNLFDWAFEESLTAIKVSRMIFEEIEKAAEEIGYQEEDDEVEYHLDPRAVYRKLCEQ